MSVIDDKIYQFHPERQYPLVVHVEKSAQEGRVNKLLNDLGFKEIDKVAKEKIMVQGGKCLHLSMASPRVAQQIRKFNFPDQVEKLMFHDSSLLYFYQNLGMMLFSHGRTHWHLGLVGDLETTAELMGLRIILNRFLAWALGRDQVLGLWGVVTGEGLLSMRASQSFGEAVFIDVPKKLILAASEVKEISGAITILRTDREMMNGKKMSTEELASFLTTHQIFLTLTDWPSTIKRAAIELAMMGRGEYAQAISVNPHSPNV